jgi:hypothetical protein
MLIFMNERLRPQKPKRRRGFIGMLEASRLEQPIIEDTLTSPEGTAKRKKLSPEIARLVRLAKHWDREIEKLGPERAQHYQDEHQAAIGPKKRAMSNPDILDMRLD